MLKFPDIAVVNKRKLKKYLKAMDASPEIIKSITESYQGKFVIMEAFAYTGNYTAMHHMPNTAYHNKVRNLPFTLTKCIRKGNPEHAKLVEI